jgi:hypothetical protein
MGMQTLVCVETTEQAVSNPPCQPGSALTVVDSNIFRPDILEGWESGVVVALVPAMIAFFLGRASAAVRLM